MGFHGFDFKSTEEIFEEHTRLTRGTNIDIGGLSYKKLVAGGPIQWPVRNDEDQGTHRLFTDAKFYTPSGKARFHPIVMDDHLSDPLTDDHPLILTTGRIRDQWHTMTKTGKVNRLRQHIDRPCLEIHPVDAISRGIKDGDPVIVNNERGEVRVTARITENIKRGVVFLPMHWGRMMDKTFGRANNLTSSRVDPVSKEPDFKFSAVQVTHYRKPRERIVLVGAGAAAYRFLCTYRSLNMSDDILVISKEVDPFYNRVLLPEYVNGSLAWERLQKFQAGEFEALNVSLSLGNEVVSLNKTEKHVTDSFGHRHYYDKLILATGTRAHVPNDAPVNLPGVFTMRTRKDADDLRNHVSAGGHVLIIGGGLLGLELAASLRDMNVAVSILQLGSRLMERQVDRLAGELLLEFIEDCGITVYMNDQIQSVLFDETTERLSTQFRSGKTLTVNAMVYAVGTRPNIEFAQAAGIETGRGILVNDYLQTSDPDVFAMGEIAEHRGITLGITSAAEKQADVLSHFLYGDMQSLYTGSVAMNILKLSRLNLCSIGMAEVPPNAVGYEEILFIDKSMRYYKKCIIHGDRLVGAILIGDKNEFAEFKDLIENGTELSERRVQLLRSGKTVEPVRGKLVCSCNQVGFGNIQALINGGCHSLTEICKQSGAGLGCGSCKPEIHAMLKSAQIDV
jgi:ferredoxin-nitrate reductase